MRQELKNARRTEPSKPAAVKGSTFVYRDHAATDIRETIRRAQEELAATASSRVVKIAGRR